MSFSKISINGHPCIHEMAPGYLHIIIPEDGKDAKEIVDLLVRKCGGILFNEQPACKEGIIPKMSSNAVVLTNDSFAYTLPHNAETSFSRAGVIK